MDDDTTPPNASKPIKFIIPVVLLLVIGAGAFFVIQSQQSPTTQTTTKNESIEVVSPTSESVTPVADPMVVDVSAENFAFNIKEIKVKKGQTVTINFSNNEGTHDWVIDEFNARTKVLQAGGKESITFVADQVGTFEYYCSVMQHRKMGMVGNLIVE